MAKTLKITIILLILVLFQGRVIAQEFMVKELSLPEEMKDPDQEFSGLFCSASQLFFLSESRLDRKTQGLIYTINLHDLDRKLKDSSYTLPFKRLPIYRLEWMKSKIKATGNTYEGLEAILIEGNFVYLSVETTTPSPNCYLLKGTLNANSLTIDTQFLCTFPKHVRVDGGQMYNAGFESMVMYKNQLMTFFEYNYFPVNNNAFAYDKELNPDNRKVIEFSNRLPFRLTDISASGKDHFTGINYFYKGSGHDTIYRPDINDSVHHKLVNKQSGYRNYCRLVDITFTEQHINWKPLWEFPAVLMGYNWEGIATYKKGYFLINDRYTPEKPYRSTLIYLNRKN